MYDASRSNTSGGNDFCMQGGSVELHTQFYRGLEWWHRSPACMPRLSLRTSTWI